MNPDVEDADAAAAVLQLPPRPYPGLRPFDPPEWPVFFGRERMVDELLDRLVAQRLVFVHGDSGCGKSSLVRAGLFAQLEQGRAGPGWKTVIALPRRAPLWNVAEALARLAGAAPDDDAAVMPWRRALNFGREAPAELATLYAPTLAARGPGCLLIDQFEELFQHAQREGAAEARLLTEMLVAWRENPPAGLYLITTMRSEYLGACARYGRFAESVNAAQYLLPPMEHADLLRAMREPARLYNGEVSRELAERLIADAGGGQDQLPLMQHALMRLHALHARDEGQPWRLELSHFPAEGGCAGMLSAHADEVAGAVQGRLGEAGHARLVEDVFRALTEINAEGQAIRRPARLAELAAVTGAEMPVLQQVLDAFRADGVNFLTPPAAQPLRPDSLIDVGHEALIRCWRVLAEPRDGWLVREFRNGLVWRSLLVQADSFEKDPGSVLGATTTEERTQWLKRRNAAWAGRYGGGWERVQKLLAASAAASEAERQHRREAEATKTRAAWMRYGLIGLVAVIAAGGWVLAQMRQELQESRLQFANAEAARGRSDWYQAQLDAERQRNATLETALRAQSSGPGGAQARLPQQRPGPTTGSSAAAPLPSNPPRPANPAASRSGARLYLHIAEAEQRAMAEQLARRLAATRLGGDPLIVPGVELVKFSPRRAELRCFDDAACRSEAPQLRELVNQLLADPRVTLEDLSARYGSSTGLRARHYELWLPAGPVTLR